MNINDRRYNIKTIDCKKQRKFILIIVVTLLLSSLILLLFKEQAEFIYDFKLQNFLMILILTIIFIKYYKNFYQLVIWINCILVCICLSINLVGCFYVGKYQFIGIKAICENYYILTAFIFNKKCKNCKIDIIEYNKKIEEDEELFDCHKDDAKYVCKFLFKSNLSTLGISARYGVGKTFIMNKVIDVTSTERNLYVEISPLSCSIEEIPTYIIGQIEKVLKENGIYTNNTRQIISTIQNGFLSSLLNIINENQTLSDLYKNLRDLIKEQDIKLTIIVDDLDRIYDKKQIQAIFIILDSIVSANCKIIYLYDSSILNKGFESEGGSKYIEKYIKNEYSLKDLTFRDLMRIENYKYIENHNSSNNMKICEMINDEVDSIEFGTKIYKYSGNDLKFDKYRLTPRLINKIIQMTYERLSDLEYSESIKGYERFVFRFYVFELYFQDFKQIICNKKHPEEYFKFKYKGNELTLEQVLARYFNVGVYDLEYPSKEKQFEEYIDFIHSEDNAEKLLALDLLGYSIDIFKEYIERRNKIDVAESSATPNEIVYNRGYVNLSYDENYNSRQYFNTKIANMVANLVNMSNSEYTDDEKFIKDFKEKVLDKNDLLEALRSYRFEKYKDNQQTTDILGQDKFTSIFNSFKKGNAKDVYWNDLMELYYKYLIKDDRIVFNDIVLININLFGFVSYRASIYAFMIISKFDFNDYGNKYLDVVSIPKTIELIKQFLEHFFAMTLVFCNPIEKSKICIEDIEECKRYLSSFKVDLQNFIKHISNIDDAVVERLENDLSYIRIALEKLISLIDNANNYKDSIERNYVKTTINYIPRDISKYKGKSKEEIDKMFDEDLNNNELRPIDYKRIMDEFNNE